MLETLYLILPFHCSIACKDSCTTDPCSTASPGEFQLAVQDKNMNLDPEDIHALSSLNEELSAMLDVTVIGGCAGTQGAGMRGEG